MRQELEEYTKKYLASHSQEAQYENVCAICYGSVTLDEEVRPAIARCLCCGAVGAETGWAVTSLWFGNIPCGSWLSSPDGDEPKQCRPFSAHPEWGSIEGSP